MAINVFGSRAVIINHALSATPVEIVRAPKGQKIRLKGVWLGLGGFGSAALAFDDETAPVSLEAGKTVWEGRSGTGFGAQLRGHAVDGPSSAGDGLFITGVGSSSGVVEFELIR